MAAVRAALSCRLLCTDRSSRAPTRLRKGGCSSCWSVGGVHAPKKQFLSLCPAFSPRDQGYLLCVVLAARTKNAIPYNTNLFIRPTVGPVRRGPRSDIWSTTRRNYYLVLVVGFRPLSFGKPGEEVCQRSYNLGFTLLIAREKRVRMPLVLQSTFAVLLCSRIFNSAHVPMRLCLDLSFLRQYKL